MASSSSSAVWAPGTSIGRRSTRLPAILHLKWRFRAATEPRSTPTTAASPCRTCGSAGLRSRRRRCCGCVRPAVSRRQARTRSHPGRVADVQPYRAVAHTGACLRTEQHHSNCHREVAEPARAPCASWRSSRLPCRPGPSSSTYPWHHSRPKDTASSWRLQPDREPGRSQGTGSDPRDELSRVILHLRIRC